MCGCWRLLITFLLVRIQQYVYIPISRFKNFLDEKNLRGPWWATARHVPGPSMSYLHILQQQTTAELFNTVMMDCLLFFVRDEAVVSTVVALLFCCCCCRVLLLHCCCVINCARVVLHLVSDLCHTPIDTDSPHKNVCGYVTK